MLIKNNLIILFCIVGLSYSFTINLNTRINFENGTKITYTLAETHRINETTLTTLTNEVKEWYSPTYDVLKKEVNQTLENTIEEEKKPASSNYTLVATKIEIL